jgi:mannose-1-phosphate guanylyltransferase
MTSPGLEHFYSVIPAGGVGSRLWPLSRADAPKFLHDLTGSGQTLLRDTWDRLAPLSGDQRIMVVTGRAHRAAVEAQLPELRDPNVVLESEPRDSSAAIGLAAAILVRREPDVIIGSFAADHVIGKQKKFAKAVTEAVSVANAGYISLIGITPTEPATGFGYIHFGAPHEIPGAPSARMVDRFVEKPGLETAKSYLDEGSYLWNASMFIARADVLLAQLGETEPELLDGLLQLAASWDTPTRGAVVDRVWPTLKKVAIDYAVAEPAAAAGRGEDARVLADSSTGVVISQGKRLISLIGVTDIVVVDTEDALLVTTTANAQRVKAVVDALKLSGRNEVL